MGFPIRPHLRPPPGVAVPSASDEDTTSDDDLMGGNDPSSNSASSPSSAVGDPTAPPSTPDPGTSAAPVAALRAPTPYGRQPGDIDYVTMTQGSPRLQEQYAPQIRQQVAQDAMTAKMNQRAAVEYNREQQQLLQQQAKRDKDLENSRRLQQYESQGRPFYHDPATGLVTPKHTDQEWQAMQEQQQKNDQLRQTYYTLGRPYTVDRSTGAIIPKQTDDEWNEVVRKKEIAEKIKMLDADTADQQANERRTLKEGERSKAQKDLVQATNDAVNMTLMPALSSAGKATQGGFLGMGASPTDAATAAKNRKANLDARVLKAQQEKAPIALDDQDMADLAKANKPLAEKISNLQQQLKADDDNRSWAQQQKQRRADLKLQLLNPQAWQQKHLGDIERATTPEQVQALTQPHVEDLHRDVDSFSKLRDSVQGQEQDLGAQHDAIVAENRQKVANGLAPDQIVTVTRNGQQETWDAGTAKKLMAWQQGASQTMDALAPARQSLTAQAKIIQGKQHLLKAAEDRAQALQKQQVDTQRQRDLENPSFAGLVPQQDQIVADFQAKQAEIEKSFPKDTADYQMAMDELRSQTQDAVQQVQEAKAAKAKAGQELYQSLAAQPIATPATLKGITRRAGQVLQEPLHHDDGDQHGVLPLLSYLTRSVLHGGGSLLGGTVEALAGKPDAATDTASALTNKDVAEAFANRAQSFGLTPDEAKYWLQFHHVADFTQGKTDDTVRVLPDGALAINPSQITDTAKVQKAIAASTATDADKEAALKVLPQQQLAFGKQLYDSLSRDAGYKAQLDAMPGDTPAAKALAFEKAAREGGWNWLKKSGEKLIEGVNQTAAEAVGAVNAATGKGKDWRDYLSHRAEAAAQTASLLPTNPVGNFVAGALGMAPGMVLPIGAGKFMEAAALESGLSKGLAAGIGGATSTAGFGVQSFGGTFNAAEEAYRRQFPEASDEEIRAKALPPAIASGLATTAIFSRLGHQGLAAMLRIPGEDAKKAAVSKVLEQSFGEMLKDYGHHASAEAVKLASSALADSVIAQSSYNPNLRGTDLLNSALSQVTPGVLFGLFGAYKSRGAQAKFDTDYANQVQAAKEQWAQGFNEQFKDLKDFQPVTAEDYDHFQSVLGSDDAQATFNKIAELQKQRADIAATLPKPSAPEAKAALDRATEEHKAAGTPETEANLRAAELAHQQAEADDEAAFPDPAKVPPPPQPTAPAAQKVVEQAYAEHQAQMDKAGTPGFDQAAADATAQRLQKARDDHQKALDADTKAATLDYQANGLMRQRAAALRQLTDLHQKTQPLVADIHQRIVAASKERAAARAQTKGEAATPAGKGVHNSANPVNQVQTSRPERNRALSPEETQRKDLLKTWLTERQVKPEHAEVIAEHEVRENGINHPDYRMQAAGMVKMLRQYGGNIAGRPGNNEKAVKTILDKTPYEKGGAAKSSTGNTTGPTKEAKPLTASSNPLENQQWAKQRAAAIAGVSVNGKDGKPDPVATGQARKKAVKALQLLDQQLENYGSLFPGGVRVAEDSPTHGFDEEMVQSGGSMWVEPDSLALVMHLPTFLRSFGGRAEPRAIQAVVEEEVIHRVTLEKYSQEQLAHFWSRLPKDIRDHVWNGYYAHPIHDGEMPTSGDEVALNENEQANMAHEFIRQLVQDSVFRKRVTESQDISPSFGNKLIAFLQNLVDGLRKLIGKAPADIRSEIKAYEAQTSQALKELLESRSKTQIGQLKQATLDASDLSARKETKPATTAATATPSAQPHPILDKAVTGHEGVAYTDQNDPIHFRWGAVEASDLVVSNHDNGAINPQYPQSFQPRDRTSAASQAQVQDIAKNANFERLSHSNLVSDGAPIIGDDGVVESGNGRVMGLRRAATENGLPWTQYQKYLLAKADSLGLDRAKVGSMKQPVLVRIRTTPLDTQQRVAFAEAANVSTVAPMREAETAGKDARNLSPDLLALFKPGENGDLLGTENRDFIRAFVRDVIPPNERPAAVDKSGQLSQSGLRRVRNALFAAAYGDNAEGQAALARLTESTDDDSRNLTSALTAAAPIFAEQKARMAQGALHSSLDLTGDIAAAVAKFNHLRAEGTKVSDWINQDRIPGIGDDLPPVQKSLLQFLDENARAPRKIGDTLARYQAAVDAAGDPRQGALFGDTVQDKAALWNLAEKYDSAKAATGPGAPIKESPLPGKAAALAYKKLFTLQQSGEQLSRSQQQTLEDAERALGQRFMFEDVRGPAPAEELRLESPTESLSSGHSRQLPLFAPQKHASEHEEKRAQTAMRDIKEHYHERLRAELRPEFVKAIEGSGPVVYPGVPGIRPSPNLDPASRVVEARFVQMLADEGDRAVRRYYGLAARDFKDPRYLNADLARFLLPQYAQDKDFRTVFDDATIAPAGYITQGRALQILLDKTNPRRQEAFFLAGGPASGKTTSAKRVLRDDLDFAKVIVDSVLRNPASATWMFNECLKRGIMPRVYFVYRPWENAVDGAIGRLIKEGRPVDVDTTADAHVEAQRAFFALADLFKEYAHFRVLANDGEIEDMRLEPLDFLREKAYDLLDGDAKKQLAETYAERLADAYRQGHLTPAQYAAARYGGRPGGQEDRGEAQATPGASGTPAEGLVKPPGAAPRKRGGQDTGQLNLFDFLEDSHVKAKQEQPSLAPKPPPQLPSPKDSQRPAPPAPSPAAESTGKPAASKSLAREYTKILKGTSRHKSLTPDKLFDLADQHFGGTMGAGTYTAKDAYDALEMAVNDYIRTTGHNHGAVDFNPANGSWHDAERQIAHLKEMMRDVPTQTRRTQETDDFQQFSTVPPLAYTAAWVAHLDPHDVVLEPSAGTGGMAVFAEKAGAHVILNELSPRRRSLLEAQDMTPHVFGEDAEQIDNVLPAHLQPNVVLMNPPFSNSGTRGEKGNTAIAARHIEQALQRLAPGGRLVAIVGEGMALDRPAFRAWWDRMRKQYDVRANVQVNGNEYSKYGTSWDNQIVVIDKTTPRPESVPLSGRVERIDDLPKLLYRIRDDRPESSGSVAEPPGGSRPASGPPAGSGDTSRSGTGRPPHEGPARPEQGRGPVAGGDQPDRGPHPSGTPRDELDFSSPPDSAGERGRPGIPAVGAEPAAADAGVEGRPAAPPASESGVAPEQLEHKRTEALTDSVYDPYQPRVTLPGSKPPPTNLAESAAMSAVNPPKVDYKPALPRELYDDPKRAPDDQRLSNHAIESILLAGHAHSQTFPAFWDARDSDDWQKRYGEAPPAEYRRGFFIGDGTGAGKGRQVAGLITDNWNQGRKQAVWVSKGSLFKDAVRDMNDVADAGHRVFDVSGTKPGDPIRKESGVGFISYEALRSREKNPPKGKPAQSRVDQLVNWLGKDFDGIIAFDESHKMANAMEGEGARGVKEASQQALAGLELQRRLPKARVVYLSATGATEVSNLAYAERLGLWGPGTPFANRSAFVSQIASGGVAAMELVAQNLKALGLYVSRSISWHDVSYERQSHPLSADQREIYDTLAEAWQVALRDMEAALEATGVVSPDGAVKNGLAKSAMLSRFWGQHQRFFNQIITSMKMPTVLKAVEEARRAGKSVVLQLVNTQAEVAKRALAKATADAAENGEDVDLDTLDMTPRDMLMQMVQSAFPVIQHETYVDAEGNEHSRPVKDASGNYVINRQAERMRDELLDKLASVRVPHGPLEMLLDHFGADQVAEVTGRTQRVVYARNEQTGRDERVVQKRSKNHALAEAQEFQDGKRHILVFSMAGGTGASYHAARNAKNQEQRVHILVQPGWQASEAVQGFGRTHRNNQVMAPHYILADSGIVGEKRFMSSIARRLDQLGALTKGQRQTGSQGFFQARDNLESTEAHAALQDFYREAMSGRLDGIAPDVLEQQMGLKMRDKNGNMLENLPGITKFLNRLLSLKLSLGEKVFEHFSDRLDRILEAKQAAGTLDTGLENITGLSTQEKARQTVFDDPRSGAKAELVHLQVEQPRDRIALEDALRHIQQGGMPHPWLVNRTTGKIAAIGARRHSTTPSGRLEDEYRIVSPDGSKRWVAAHRISSLYEAGGLNDQEARSRWQQEHDAAPQTRHENVHLLTGTMLPIWDKIPGYPRVVRAQTDQGVRMIGREIPRDSVPVLRKNLGVGEDKPLDSTDAVAAARFGGSAKLSNGWKIKKTTVAGEPRLEIVGPQLHDHGTLDAAGMLRERHQFQMRYYLPKGTEEATLQKLLDHTTATITETQEGRKGPGAPAKEQTFSGRAQPVGSTIRRPGYNGPIGLLEPGDEIASPAGGVQRVIATHPQGYQPVYRLTLQGGKAGTFTANHLFVARVDDPHGQPLNLRLSEIQDLRKQGRKVFLPAAG